MDNTAVPQPRQRRHRIISPSVPGFEPGEVRLRGREVVPLSLGVIQKVLCHLRADAVVPVVVVARVAVAVASPPRRWSIRQ